ncbi:unnamed protein product [Adineta steineri]|uniref:Uncharacterized protein n=1 Tax=Adineta steineri TaxID=433720 RepID=A0A815IK60_9BILA|nr:unnamed protein product [Adineta steineri]CAF1602221.1 unnamed protein product [Adineta steineri]
MKIPLEVHMGSGVQDTAQSLAGGITQGSASLGAGAKVIGYGLGIGLIALGAGIAFGQALRRPTVIYSNSMFQIF